MSKKEKKSIAPNEASLVRWIVTLLVGCLISFALCIPMAPLLANQEGSFLGIPRSQIVLNLCFAAMFVGLVIALKVIAKTSLKDFVLGVGNKINKKECLIVLGLYTLGFVLTYLPSIPYISLRGVKAGEFAFLIVYMLLLVWMQSTWEEFVFRGLLIRWGCKNNMVFSKKSLIIVLITSIAFALGHASNPEVLSQSGIQVAICLLSYGITGMLFFFVSLYFGNLMPGILIHWVNNFLLCTVISSEVSAVSAPTLLVDSTPHTAGEMIIGNFLPWIPILVYIFLDFRKKKKAVSVA